ncbi:MAG: hypothetical protein AAGA30_09540 [Planctomycetota bacterium]
MLRNILAVVVGIMIGSLVNILLVNLGPLVVPLPEGADVTDMEKLRESMKLMKPANFLFPFLGHAIGTLVGAFLAAKIARSWKMGFAMVIGVFFLFGGFAAIKMLGGPMWFNVTDIALAYLPMGYLGGILAGGKNPSQSAMELELTP